MTEHKNYITGAECEFRAGCLRGGVILEDLGSQYLCGYHGPKYMEIILEKDKVKVLYVVHVSVINPLNKE